MQIKNIDKNIERGSYLIESDTKVVIGKNVTVTAVHDVDSFYSDDSVFWDTCGNELGRALFFANGYRMRKYFDGHTRDKAGSIKNVTIENVTANVYCNENNEYTKQGRGVLLVTGTPNIKLENIEIKNSVFNMPGGETDAQKEYEVKELTDGYPEYYFLGTTPSYGAYIRHANGVKLKDVKFNLISPDIRKEIIAEDVKNLTIE